MTRTAPSTQLLRRVNAAALLALMRESDVVTGTELVQATGLTRATVISVCEDLTEMGWVKELASQRHTDDYVKGRPARRFTFDAGAGHVLGIDLGAGKTTALLTDLVGKPLARVTQVFDDVEAPADHRLKILERTALAAVEEADIPRESVLAAAVGVAAPVSRDSIVTTDHWWQMFDVDLRAVLAERHGWHVLVENDANLAALAEQWRGKGQGVEDLVVMLAGERLGSGILESGRLLHGNSGGFGELGFVGLLEGVEAPSGIAKLARIWGQQAVRSVAAPTSLHDLCHGDYEALTAEMVFAAAADGDRVAREILDRVSTAMARVIAAVSTLVDPELVVIGGAVADSADLFIPAITERLPAYTASSPRIAASQLGDSIVTIGAVRRALSYVEDHALDLRPARWSSRSRES